MLARYNLTVISQPVQTDPVAWQAATTTAITQYLNSAPSSAGCPLSARAGIILTQLLITLRAPPGNWSSGSQAPPLIITNISGAVLALGSPAQQQLQAAQPPQAPPPPPTSASSTSTFTYTWWWILLVFVALLCGSAAGVAMTVLWARQKSKGVVGGGGGGAANQLARAIACETCGCPGQLQLQSDLHAFRKAAGSIKPSALQAEGAQGAEGEGSGSVAVAVGAQAVAEAQQAAIPVATQEAHAHGHIPPSYTQFHLSQSGSDRRTSFHSITSLSGAHAASGAHAGNSPDALAQQHT